jgi:hypothetical protein
MSYRPLPTSSRPRTSQVTNLMPEKGLNKRFLPQLLDTSFALSIINYHIVDKGRIVKRKGFTKMFEVAGQVPITVMIRYDDDTIIFGYGTTIARFTESTETVTTIKSDFSASTFGFGGQRFGKYAFVCNGVDKVWMIDETFTATEVTDSPRAKGIKIIGSRMYAYNLAGDGEQGHLAYSAISNSGAVPFTDWTVGTSATSAGLITNQVIGGINTVEAIGDNVLGTDIVVWGDYGKYSFFLNNIDVGGVVSKVDVFRMSRIDSGGAKGAISMELGIVYVNKEGLHILQGLTPSTVGSKDVEYNTSVLLGPEFFDNINLDNASITFNAQRKEIYLTCGQDSAINNIVLCYNYEHKAYSVFSGWNLNLLLNDRGTIYGASASRTAIYRCFDGQSDDGNAIGTELYQEIPTGALEAAQKAKEFYTYGLLSSSSNITISFDKYDKKGLFKKNVKRISWTPTGVSGGGFGWNEYGWNEGAYGGQYGLPGTIEDFSGYNLKINNYQRIRVRYTAVDKVPHALGWFSIMSRSKRRIRRRNMTEL